MPWLPVIFVVLPFTELMILLKIGAEWGVLPTLGLIIVTATIGYQLFRHQGMSTWQRVNQKVAQGEMPTSDMTEGVLILMAGVLMITPGLITDTIGLLCLLPFTRRPLLKLLGKRLMAKVTVYSSATSQTSEDPYRSNSGKVFDGEAHEVKEAPSENTRQLDRD